MPSITSAGSASGMDFESIIAASVQAKKTQLANKTTKKKEETNITLSGVGKLKSALETFQKSLKSLTEDGGFNTRKVTTDQPKDNPYFSITTKDDAANGSYDIAVKQLASNEKLSQTFGKEDKIGTGTLKLTLPGVVDPDTGEKGEPREIEINITEELTVAQLRRKINEVAGDQGINASVISSSEGEKLVIDTGLSGADAGGFKMEFTSDGKSDAGIGSKFNYDSTGDNKVGEDGNHQGWDVIAGKDAKISVDGQELTSKTNEFKNISGITITVNRVSEKEGDGFKTNNATIDADYEAVSKKMQEFVNAYNALMEGMDSLYKHNTYTDGQNNYDGGELSGDSMLRSLKGQIEDLVSNMKSNGNVDIYSLGIEIDRNGKMKLDSTKFQEGLKDNFNAVVNLFSKDVGKEGNADENGLLVKLQNTVNEYTKSDGILKNREDELNKIIKDYEAQETKNAQYLEQYEASLRQKYGKLDTTIAGYNNSLMYLQSALI